MLLAASLYPWMWRAGLADALGALADAGFQRAELLAAPPHIYATSDAAEGVRDRRDVTIVSVNVPTMDVNLASPDPVMRQMSVAQYTTAIDVAGEIGANRVVVSPGKRHPLIPPPLTQVVEWSAASLSALIARAESRGARIVLENLPYGFMSTVDELARFNDEHLDGGCEVMLDVANAHMVEDVNAAATRLDALGLIHLSDTTRQSWHHDEIGLGDIDFASLRAACRGDAATIAVLEIVADEPVEALRRSATALRHAGWDL